MKKPSSDRSKTTSYDDEEIITLFPATGFVVRLIFADESYFQDTAIYPDRETAEAWAIVEQALAEANDCERG